MLYVKNGLNGKKWTKNEQIIRYYRFTNRYERDFFPDYRRNDNLKESVTVVSVSAEPGPIERRNRPDRVRPSEYVSRQIDRFDWKIPLNGTTHGAVPYGRCNVRQSYRAWLTVCRHEHPFGARVWSGENETRKTKHAHRTGKNEMDKKKKTVRFSRGGCCWTTRIHGRRE